MNLSPSEIQEMRRVRLASSVRASGMTPVEVARQISASGCEWKPNPRWNGKSSAGGERAIQRIFLKTAENSQGETNIKYSKQETELGQSS